MMLEVYTGRKVYDVDRRPFTQNYFIIGQKLASVIIIICPNRQFFVLGPRGPKQAENMYKISGFLVDFCGFVWVDQRLSTWISGFLSSSCTGFLLCF